MKSVTFWYLLICATSLFALMPARLHADELAGADLKPTLARGIAAVSSVPLFHDLAAEPELRSYTVPVDLDVTIHKFFFSFGLRRHGIVRYESPATLTVSLDSVPPRYTDVFGQLGTMRTWPITYTLALESATPVDGRTVYRVAGVPREPADVASFSLLAGDPAAPLRAQWMLHSGWTIASTIDPQDVGGHMLPKHDAIDIHGHGLSIHCEMAFGTYAVDDRAGAVPEAAGP